MWSCSAVWRGGAVRRAQGRAHRHAVQLPSGDVLQLLCPQVFVIEEHKAERNSWMLDMERF